MNIFSKTPKVVYPGNVCTPDAKYIFLPPPKKKKGLASRDRGLNDQSIARPLTIRKITYIGRYLFDPLPHPFSNVPKKFDFHF